jgi:hypothetical protein
MIGLFTPKYIGLEAILTLQLIYYSLILVLDSKKYPIGFNTFKYFKYSNGYNEILNISYFSEAKDMLISKLEFM